MEGSRYLKDIASAKLEKMPNVSILRVNRNALNILYGGPNTAESKTARRRYVNDIVCGWLTTHSESIIHTGR